MKKIMFCMACILFLASPAIASEDSCDQECSDGKVAVGYGDGNKATCTCVEPGEGMVETVPEAAENPTEEQG